MKMNKENVLRVKEVKIDIILATVLSIISFIYLWYAERLYTIFDNYGIFLSISATLMGFLITSFTILIAFPENNKIKTLKKHETYPSIYRAFLLSIKAQILLFVTSLLGLLSGFSQPIYCFIIVWALVLSIIFVRRAVWILKKLIDLYFSTSTKS